MRKGKTLAVAAVATLIWAAPAFGGEGKASISGSVEDLFGDPVMGVRIEALEGDEVLGSSVTDKAGAYSIADLATGDYLLRLDPKGTGFQGQTVKAPLGLEGLDVQWTVSVDRRALAMADGVACDVAAGAAVGAGAGAGGGGGAAATGGVLGAVGGSLGTTAGVVGGLGAIGAGTVGGLAAGGKLGGGGGDDSPSE